jgi:Kdo2-lipid IVA lauroyltransferase/acyltransferase
MTHKATLKFFPFYLVSYLPFPVLFFLSDLTYMLLYYVLKYRRQVVSDNLSKAFPDKNRTELKTIERAYYKHLCDIAYESLKSLSLSPKGIKKRMQYKNIDLLNRYHQTNRSAILYAGHFGNWEWISFLPLSVSHQVTSFYQPLKNKYFDELVKKARGRFGAICVESNKGVKSVLTFEQEKILTINLIIGDQSPKKKSQKYWTRFLDQDTAFLIGADKIAQKANHVLLFPFYKKIKRGYYELEFQIITESPMEMNSEDIIDSYANHLEQAIKSAPEMWLWSHNRWKLKRDSVDKLIP